MLRAFGGVAIAAAFGAIALVQVNRVMGSAGHGAVIGGEKAWFSPRIPFAEARGFHAPELSSLHETFNWTRDVATLNFRQLGRSEPTQVVLRVAAPRPETERPPRIEFLVDGASAATVDGAPSSRRVVLNVPPAPRAGAIVEIRVDTTLDRGGEPLGVIVERVRIARARGEIPPPPRALGAAARAGAVTFGGLALAGLALAPALVISCVASLFLAFLAASGGALLGEFPSTSSLLVALCVGIAAAGALIGRPAPGLRLALCWVGLVLGLKLAFLAHPMLPPGDAFAHGQNVARVAGGDLFFTSSTPPPAFAFPYPISLYVAALPYRGAFADPVSLVRLLALLASSAAALALARAVTRAHRSDHEGALAAAFLSVVTGAITVLGTGNLSNLFADAALATGLCILAAHPGRGGAALAFVALLGAAIGHFGTFLATVPLLAIGAWLMRTTADKRVWSACAAGVPLVSYLLYYRHFHDVFAAGIARLATPAAQEGPMALPLATKVGALWSEPGFAVGMLALAAIGCAPLLRRPRNAWESLLLSWLAVGAAFTILGLVSPVQIRAALVASPAVAALAARGFIDLCKLGPLGRVGATLLAAEAVLEAGTSALGCLVRF